MLSIKNTIDKLFQRKHDFNQLTTKTKLYSSILAGIYIAFGAVLMLTCGGLIPFPYKPLIMGATFSIALLLIIFAGGELYTGHCMIQNADKWKSRDKKTKINNLAIIWIGNLIGACIIAGLVVITGLSDPTLNLLISLSLTKVSIPFIPLLIKAILCNVFVCLAIWIATRTDDNPTKILLTWFCIFAFVVCGFEHSIANMAVLSLGYLSGSAITISDILCNLIVTTIGNYIGGAALIKLYDKSSQY